MACGLLTACGAKTDQEGPWIGIAPGSDLTAVTERTEYYDLAVETEALFDLGLWEKNPEEYDSTDIQERGITIYNLLGTQFTMGEPAQLWSEATPLGVNLYLYRTDGSRELLVSGLPDDDDDFADAIYEGYVDQDKNCYLYYINWPEMNGEYTPVSTVMKLLPTGELSYQKSLEAGFKLEDICQTEDGRLYLLLNEYETGKEVLEEFNAETGKVIPESRMEWNSIDAWISSLGTAGVSPARTTLRGIDSVDMAAQKISPLLYFGELLHTFLQGSESLWGMVDWGAGDKDSPGSCDFNTPLFAKLLEAAKRYGYEDRRALEQEITHRINLSGFFSFSSPAEQKEEELVSVGTLFDDGCHAVSYPLYTMAVNANSANKEGAWEFIAFLLGDEIQYREEAHLPPVHRQSFDKWLEWELEILTKKDRIKGQCHLVLGKFC